MGAPGTTGCARTRATLRRPWRTHGPGAARRKWRPSGSTPGRPGRVGWRHSGKRRHGAPGPRPCGGSPPPDRASGSPAPVWPRSAPPVRAARPGASCPGPGRSGRGRQDAQLPPWTASHRRHHAPCGRGRCAESPADRGRRPRRGSAVCRPGDPQRWARSSHHRRRWAGALSRPAPPPGRRAGPPPCRSPCGTRTAPPR